MKPTSILWFAMLLACISAMAAGSVAAHDDHHHTNEGESTPAASPAANTGTGIVYLSIDNHGDAADRLIGARTDAAQDVTFHASGGGGDVMRMTEQEGGFAIEPGATLVFEPGGAHLMLENLNHDLQPGTTFNVTLTFEVAGEIEIEVTVGGEAPDGDPVQVGDLRVSPAWSLPAPRLGDATPDATHQH